MAYCILFTFRICFYKSIRLLEILSSDVTLIRSIFNANHLYILHSTCIFIAFISSNILILGVIITTFRSLCLPAFFRCLLILITLKNFMNWIIIYCTRRDCSRSGVYSCTLTLFWLSLKPRPRDWTHKCHKIHDPMF